jgi:hypothetical protein
MENMWQFLNLVSGRTWPDSIPPLEMRLKRVFPAIRALFSMTGLRIKYMEKYGK